MFSSKDARGIDRSTLIDPHESHAGAMEMSVIRMSESDDTPRHTSNEIEHGEAGQLLLPQGYSQNTFALPQWIRNHFNFGNVSNYVTFFVMILGLMIRASVPDSESSVGRYILSLGLFGFAGGITNWLAIKMLFDQVPFLYGSGVVPRRFKEIRETVKNTIMKTFFDSDYLQRYIMRRKEQFLSGVDIEAKVKEFVSSPTMDQHIDDALTKIQNGPEGMLLAMMGITIQQVKMLIKPFILNFAVGAAPKMLENIDVKTLINMDKIRDELDHMMTDKLEELTPDRVKALLEDVIRTHLGWLIVWGNVFGAVIGLISAIAGY
eukprot:GILJ01007488.1.p1 GENE.GILJ01007488.1~~GILJ01007488.1.p1  ORF type:complete len:340 (+),score=45.29 GILJ01007488.1:63-1022(+)